MDLRRAGQDVAGQVAGAASPVRDPAAGFQDEGAAGEERADFPREIDTPFGGLVPLSVTVPAGTASKRDS